MATLVGLRRGSRTIGYTEHQVIEIVDGQQRITTLILMLKAIAKAIVSSDSGTKVGRDLNDSLVKDDKATLLLLQTNHDSSDYFANYLRYGTHPPSTDAKTVADKELLSAMEECESFVTEWQDGDDSLMDLITLLNNRLTFVFHEIGDEALVYTVFEVLNSRGLDVSWFDRLKSMLMAIVFESETGNESENINEIHQLWGQIYECVGLRLGLRTESLRFAATLWQPRRPNRTLSEEAAALLLDQQSQGGPEKVIETTSWLKDVTNAVDQLAANHRINAVTRIAQARMVATAVYLRSDFNSQEKAKIFRTWENVTFRIYGMSRKDARWAVGDYVRLAWNIIREQLSADAVIEGLLVIGKGYSIADAVESMRETDCYTYWGEELRYFLHRYEEHLAKKVGQNFDNEQWNRIWERSAASSIEHIRPQSWWTDRGRESDEGRMHGLGNLMMLPPGLNSKLQDKPPRRKVNAYISTGLLTAQEVADTISGSGWSFATIKEREERMLEWAREEWAE